MPRAQPGELPQGIAGLDTALGLARMAGKKPLYLAMLRRYAAGQAQAGREIRSIARLQRLPIVAMTANAMETDRHKCMDEGMNDFLVKPIDPQDMWAVLVRWIRPGKGAAAPAAPTAMPRAQPGELPQGIAGLDTALGLARMAGKKPLYLAMLRRYAAGQAQAGREIRDALAASDRATAERIAHTLKGVSGNVGATAVQDLAAVVEHAIHGGLPAEEIGVRLVELELPLASLVADLQAQLPTG
jgi:two-component system sensor histidine kinase/response regulator